MAHNQYVLFDGKGDEKAMDDTKRRTPAPVSARVVELDPSRVRVWSGNGRAYEHLTAMGCGDLIDAIIAAGGQQIPVVVRPIRDDPHHAFELIVGTRRHWAISWIRANGRPDFALRAIISSFSDEQAFLLADIENRARTDISALERARSYKDALFKYYDGRQATMADRLRISASWLSKHLAIANLPSDVLAPFASEGDLTVNPAYQLAKAWDKNPEGILARASVLAQRRHSGYASRLTTKQVIDQIISPGQAARKEPLRVYRNAADAPAITVERVTSAGDIVIRLHAKTKSNLGDLSQYLANILKDFS